MDEDQIYDYDPYDPKSVYLKENPRPKPRPLRYSLLFIGGVMASSLLLYWLVLANLNLGQGIKVIIALIGGPTLAYFLITLGMRIAGRRTD